MPITMLWNMKKDRLKVQVQALHLAGGATVSLPDNKDDMEYYYERGFDDVFTKDTDLQFPSFL